MLIMKNSTTTTCKSKSKEENNANHLFSESSFKLLNMKLDNIRIDVKNANQELRNRLSDIQALLKEMHDIKALIQKPKRYNVLAIQKLLIEPTKDQNYGLGFVELSAGVYKIANEESTPSHASKQNILNQFWIWSMQFYN